MIDRSSSSRTRDDHPDDARRRRPRLRPRRRRWPSPTTRPACVPPDADGSTIASGRKPAAADCSASLERGEHLAPRADRPGAAHRHDRHAPPLPPEVRCNQVDDRLALGPVCRDGAMDRPAEQLDQLDVRRSIDVRPAEHEVHVEPQARARHGGETAVVGPAPPGRDDRVGPVRDRGGEEELEIPELVAGEGDRAGVLALDPEVRPPAEGRGQPRHGLERRRAIEQPVTRGRTGMRQGSRSERSVGRPGRMPIPSPLVIDEAGARTLLWDGCVNVRDLGGIPTEDGGVTRSGAGRSVGQRRGADARPGWRALERSRRRPNRRPSLAGGAGRRPAAKRRHRGRPRLRARTEHRREPRLSPNARRPRRRRRRHRRSLRVLVRRLPRAQPRTGSARRSRRSRMPRDRS